MTDGPYMVDRGDQRTEDWLLTHREWHPNCWFGDFGQPETGVRRVVDGEIDDGSFSLIQHGWTDFEAAGALILRGLVKGWDTSRIWKLMTWLKERR